VSDYFSANRFEISRDMMVGQYKVDLVGFRMSAGFSFLSSVGKFFVCFVSYQPNPNEEFAKTFTEASAGVAREKYPPPFMVAHLVFPVMVSERFDPNVIQFIEDFEPKYLSREAGRLTHPVLVELGTKSIYHRKGSMMGAIGYKKPINQFVQNALTP